MAEIMIPGAELQLHYRVPGLSHAHVKHSNGSERFVSHKPPHVGCQSLRYQNMCSLMFRLSLKV